MAFFKKIRCPKCHGELNTLYVSQKYLKDKKIEYTYKMSPIPDYLYCKTCGKVISYNIEIVNEIVNDDKGERGYKK